MTYNDFKLLTEGTRFKVLDTETTGLNFYGYRGLNGDRITDICIYTVQDGQIVDKFSTLINPERDIPENIVKLTGIENSMVKWAKTFDGVAADIYNYLGGDIIVGHNVSFDWDKFIVPSFKHYVGYYPTNQTIDTLDFARTFMQNAKNHKLGTVYTDLTGKKPKGAHRAEADVVMTVEVFLKLREFAIANKEAILKCFETPENVEV